MCLNKNFKRTYVLLLIILFVTALCSSQSYGQTENSFEVGTGTIASTFGGNNTFTSFTFANSFAQTPPQAPPVLPLIFILPSIQGGDECDVRIRNVSLTGFDAYCTEAPPRDGEHVAVDIQYIALLPGVTTIPTTSGGSVTFEAGSLDTQTVQHNCPAAAGCGTEGWDIVTPTAVNPSNSAILRQIQTMNNESGNPPVTNSQPFLTTAMDLNQGAANQFGIALERNEVDEGSINTNEQIAWLAIEDTNGCEMLDFSGLGGPASVAFQSIVTDDLAVGAAGGDIHGAPDGWNDGCNNGEGAAFEAACFTNTPVVLANKRTRNEEDGGWLRQCGISSTGINVTIDEDRSTDNERNHVNEGISVLAFGQSFTTPVTLSHISITQLDRFVTFKWETSTETLNVGFNLWGKVKGKWEQLNRRLVQSNRKDKLQPNVYSRNIRLSAFQRDQITEFGISSVDVSGKDEFFGPFKSGQSYGEAAIPEPIDWQIIKAQFEQNMLAKGYQFINGVWRRTTQNTTSAISSRVDIKIKQSGIYRITYEQLLAQGIDWSGVRTNTVALTHQGKPIARTVVGSRGIFGAGSWIEFFAIPPKHQDALYTNTNTYQLELNRGLTLFMPRVTHIANSHDELSSVGFQRTHIGENRIYTELSEGDPWMDAELFSAGSSTEKSYTFNIDQIAVDEASRIAVSLTGGTDLPGSIPDHHVLVYVNDRLVANSNADGFERWQVNAMLPANILKHGENTVRIVAAGDTGLQFDLFNIDTITVYSAKNLRLTNDLPLEFTAQSDLSNIKIATETANRPQVYITQDSGNVARITQPQYRVIDGQNYWLLPATAMQDSIGDVNYWLGSVEQMLTPQLFVTQAKNISVANTDYLIIAHPNFINEQLEKFALNKTNSGLSTKIINWLEIVESYGYGLNSPQALRNFLTIANHEHQYKYVLLVGGHSYDYLDYMNQGSINFIPTWHRGIDLIQQAPTDTPYVDLDADGLPDKAIGRWPVRTHSDLNAIITKTQEWQTKGLSASRNALFIAEQTEANRDFDELLENSMAPVSNRWNDIDKVYLDDILQQNSSNPINNARQQVFDSINAGVGLTVFNGHGSPSSWTFQSLVSWNHLKQLENYGLPTMVLPLACYTTYYQTPTVNSLAHQWLFASQDQEKTTGAVTIHGAMVLGDFRENTLFAEKVLQHQLGESRTIGNAILQAKRGLAPWNHMVNNWALLGDPSLKLQP